MTQARTTAGREYFLNVDWVAIDVDNDLGRSLTQQRHYNSTIRRLPTDITFDDAIEAATFASGLSVLPLAALHLSKRNVRPTPGKCRIWSSRRKVGKKKTHTHEVVAGGHRYRALALLVREVTNSPRSSSSTGRAISWGT